MNGSLSECLTIIAQIESHFADQGWQPLLQVKVNAMKALSYDNLRALLPKVLAAPERIAAVTAILEAAHLESKLPITEKAAGSESSDWDVLQLRPDDRSQSDPK